MADERAGRKVLALSLVGLSVFLGAQALMLRSYIQRQKRPPSYDQSVHMEIALDYRQAARQRRWSDIVHLAPKPGMPPFPPLYHLLLMRAYDSPDPAGAALWVNWFYLALLTLSLFFVCFAFRPDWAALGAAIAFVASPAVQELLYTQLVDLAVVALVAAAYWALVASDNFKKWGASLAFGVLFGLGMLHKWSYFSYMVPAGIAVLMALGERKGRWPALAACALAAAMFVPWYWAHAAILLPRLIQASSDFAIPVTQGGAFFTYLLISADGLSPLFWVLGWAALAVPNYRSQREKSWLVWAWVLTSYLFWAVVPNRQLRFLLPGLSGLAVAMCGAWPTGLVWAVTGFQLIGAINYAAGWVGPIEIPTPIHDIALFPNNPPGTEEWHLADILKTAEAQADPARPIADLTLVANAQYFNGPNFTWMSRALGLSKVRIRGVNKRLCELSEFVVLKDDKLGPAGVIEGLPEAAKIVTDPKGWFAKAYEPAAKWPLPDGSNAVLYKQRRFERAPFKSNGTQFMFYESGPLTATDFRVKLSPWDASAAEYPAVTASAQSIVLRGLKVSHPVLELDGAVLVPASDDKKAPEWDEVRLLKIRRLKLLSGEIAADDLKTFLEDRVKGLRVDRLNVDKTIGVSGQSGHFAFSAEAAVALLASPPRLRVDVLHARLGATELPKSLLGAFGDYTLSLEPTPELPFQTELRGLTIKDGKITIP